jgi:hypothetical protein
MHDLTMAEDVEGFQWKFNQDPELAYLEFKFSGTSNHFRVPRHFSRISSSCRLRTNAFVTAVWSGGRGRRLLPVSISVRVKVDRLALQWSTQTLVETSTVAFHSRSSRLLNCNVSSWMETERNHDRTLNLT